MGWFDDSFHKFVGDPVKSVWDDFTGKSQQKSANKQNILLQQNQQKWEQEMSNTAVQRRYADLQAAGINPLLAAGQSADVPNVAPARVEAAPSGASGVTKAMEAYASVNSAMALAASARKANAEASVTEDTHDSLVGKAGQEVEALKAQIDNIQNDTDLKFWDVAVKKIEGKLKNLDLEQKRQMMPLLVRELTAAMRQKEAGVPGAEKRAEAWRSVVGTFAAYAELITPTFNSAIGAGALGKIGSLLKRGTTVKGGLPAFARPKGGLSQSELDKFRPSGYWR